MDALLVVDMQEGLRLGSPKHELECVVARINRLSDRVRSRGGQVIFVQHDGAAGDDFEPTTRNWALLAEVDRAVADRVIHKTLNDAFFGTELEHELREIGATRVLVTGWATDLCVDATVRSAAARGFAVTVVADAHTVSDRPHLAAPAVIAMDQQPVASPMTGRLRPRCHGAMR